MGFVLCYGIASFWPLLILSCTLGERTEPVYELIGKEVQLDPKVTETITSITWKKEKDKIAEWDKNLGHDYYGRCLTAEQCKLIATSGVLVLKGLKREDAGDYFPEINGKASKDTFPLAVLEPVSKPNVTVSCNETQCTLTCVGKETKHTKYSWKENDETVKGGNILTVHKTGDQSKSYTCVFSNPKSEEHSDPLTEMELFPEPVSKPNVTVSCNETQCTLTCVGEETKHTKYSWKENDETVKGGNILTIHKTGDQSKSYTCVFSNPKSKEHSDPLTKMDLFPAKGPPVSYIVLGVILGVVVLLVVLAVLLAVNYRRKMKALEEEPPCRNGLGGQNKGNPSASAGNNPEETAMLVTSKAAEPQKSNGEHEGENHQAPRNSSAV